MLEVKNLTASYRGVVAVRAVDIAVPTGQTVALLGPNGAGKSTTLLSIVGAHKHDRGTVTFDGRDVGGLPAERRVAAGIALVPEGRHLFMGLNVMQNLLVGFTGTRRPTKRFPEFREWVFELFPRLRERSNQAAGSLSGGEQQMLAIARALASEPRLLMLDEPSLGLAPPLVRQVYQTLETLRSNTEVSVLIVEQYAQQALEFSDFAYVMRNGRMVASGPSEELLDNQTLINSYLGG